MNAKTCLCLALVLFAVAGCASVERSVRLESCPAPGNFKRIYADADYEFGSVRHEVQAEVLVFSRGRREWKRIAEVSLANARLGGSPRLAQINMDFAYVYRGKEYAPVPLRDTTGDYPIFPDKIEFEAQRKIYLIYFNSMWRDVSVTNESEIQRITSKLEMRKRDLDASFNAK